MTNADDSAETVAVRAAANALVTSYDDLGRELAAEATPGSRAAMSAALARCGASGSAVSISSTLWSTSPWSYTSRLPSTYADRT